MPGTLTRWGNELRSYERFSTSIDPRGRDTGREGTYLIFNTGPAERGGKPKPPPGDHSRISFPFTEDGGVAGRFGLSFWMEPKNLGDQTLFEYGTGDRNRNRIALEIKSGELMFTVLDEAGIDPQPNSNTKSSPDRAEIQWRVPLAELGTKPGVATHVNMSAFASRPTDVSLLVDGAPRGKPKFATYLTTALPTYDPTKQQVLPGSPTKPTDVDLYVESTDNFPAQGVLRIGLELFEYTSVSTGVFHCQWKDSMGGRMARMSSREFHPNIPIDGRGRSKVDYNSLTNSTGVNTDIAPEHPVGSLVELYGYSTLPWPASYFAVGDTKVSGSVGQWALARVYVQNPLPITVSLGNRSIQLGKGLDFTTVKDLELADPTVVVGNRNPPPPPPASQQIADAFPTTGGIALLIQHYDQWRLETGPTQPTGLPQPVGGIEVIKYSARQGTKLTGIQRAYRLPGDNSAISPAFFDGTARRFVTEWTLMAPNAESLNAYLNHCLFVVPISLPVQGVDSLQDPGKTGITEWAQLYQQGNEYDTEWVRYDQIAERTHLTRGDRGAWDRLRFLLTNENAGQMIGVGPLGMNTQPLAGITYQPVQATSGYIGYIPNLESLFPVVYYARQQLLFRGDSQCGTSSHPQNNSVVLPCHRVDLNWGNYGACSGRLGRNDRIALVAGSSATGTSRPAVEWHTMNWQWRHYTVDTPVQTGQGGVGQTTPVPGREKLGQFPFQLVAFKERAGVLIQGPALNQGNILDPRMEDRCVKFPSGELPAAYVAEVAAGGAAKGGPAMSGILDEVSVTTHLAYDLTLDQECTEGATTITARPDMTLLANGPWLPGGDLSAQYPKGGGLVNLDGELIAFKSCENGVFTVATNGRALLGTKPHGHDRGARMRFLTHVPAAILSNGVQARTDVLAVQKLGALPLRGTVYMGGELLHYAWVRQSGDQASLEMPRYVPPGEDVAEGGTMRGLFRGRYGTSPRPGASGEVLIGWPIRYWDRYTEGADDPEMASFQLTHVQSPVLWQTVNWNQETTDKNVQVLALARVDNHGSFADPAGSKPGMFKLQLQAGDDRPLKLDWMGSQFELRFFTVYKTGVFLANTWTAHAWKTAPKIKNVVVEYEGQSQILRERITVR
jgi:hypothetical protein